MDWQSRGSQFFEGDLSLLEYGSGQVNILQAMDFGTGLEEHNIQLLGDHALSDWLSVNENIFSGDVPSGVLIMLCNRANEDEHNPATLLEVPFSGTTFKRIREFLKVKTSIVRAINRGAAVFTCMIKDGHVYYDIRTTNMQKYDLAMTVAGHLHASFTRAVMFGCKPLDTRDFEARLRSSGPALMHPMLLPGIFAEIQRKRDVDAVNSNVTKMLQYISNLGLGISMTKDQSNILLKHWIDIGYLSSCIETWKAQLLKMAAHIDELENLSGQRNPEFVVQGNRIKGRLLDIITEYEELRRKCAIVVDGTSLANSILWNKLAQEENKLNREIAQASQRDSSQMKSIALLTMIFLPGTYVASFFAMPLFNWDADSTKGEKVYSEHFWIYWLVSGILTSAITLVWILWS